MCRNYYFQNYITLIMFNHSIHLSHLLSFLIGVVTRRITHCSIFLVLPWLNQSKLETTVLNQWKHSKSMDWIDSRLWKSKVIHLLKWKGLIGDLHHMKKQSSRVMNRNHFTYWIVNHWNRFKLVNIVSVILLANLNWRIVHNYNPFKLGQLDIIHRISLEVPL